MVRFKLVAGLVLAFAFAPLLCSAQAPNIENIYDTAAVEKPADFSTSVRIYNQQGNSFDIAMLDGSWSGHGTLTGSSASYQYTDNTGDSGTATFTVGSNGVLTFTGDDAGAIGMPWPRAKAKTAANTAACGGDSFCGLMAEVFAARNDWFQSIRTSHWDKDSYAFDSTVQCPGAGWSDIKHGRVLESNGEVLEEANFQFSCGWRRLPSGTGPSKYESVLASIQRLVPSNWTVKEKHEKDFEHPGAIWLDRWDATEPGGENWVTILREHDDVIVYIYRRY